jgi:hypothetical protein
LRESIPVEAILKAYMDESVEEDVIEEVKEEVTHEPIIEPHTIEAANGLSKSGVSFNDIDYIKTDNGISQINAPKNLDRLEEISAIRNEQRKIESEHDDGENVKLNISDQSFDLDNLDVHNIEEPKLDLLPDLLIDEIEILE